MPSLIVFLFASLSFSPRVFPEDLSGQPPVPGLTPPGTALQSAEDWLPLRPQQSHKDLQDHLARVFEIQGEARLLKHSTDSWVPLQKDMIIEAGDQIVTEAESKVKITYDDHFLNIAVIKEKSKVEFRSIEPTDVHLEDGSIFSVVERLNGDTYQISTPTAVAAVRGTHFSTAYDAHSGSFSVNLFPDGGDRSHVVVTDTEQGQQGASVDLAEGEKLVAENDNVPMEQELIEPMTNEEINEYHQDFEDILENTDQETRLKELIGMDTPLDPSEEDASGYAGTTEAGAYEDVTAMDEEVDQTVDQVLESQLTETDLLGNDPVTDTPADEPMLDQTSEAPESEEENNLSAEEVISEPELTEFLYEAPVEEENVSLQDEITSEQAAENEQNTGTEDTSGTTNDSGSSH